MTASAESAAVWAAILPQKIVAFIDVLKALEQTGRRTTATWLAHGEVLRELRRATRRKSKGWRRHVRRMKAASA